MKLYRDTVYILLLVDVLSIFGVIVYQNELNHIGANISVSIFTGSLLATIISLVSYFNEKKIIEEINIKTRNLCFCMYFVRANLIHALDCTYIFYQGLQLLTNEHTIAQIKDENARDFLIE